MPPGRPRSFNTEQALAEAQDLFWRQGYRGTTTRDLERALGINQSSIYNAFGSKADLLDAVLARYESQLTQEVIGPLHDSSEGLDAVDAFVARFVGWVVSNGSRGCLIARMMGESNDLGKARGRLDTYRAGLRRAVTDGLERAAEAGEISADSVGWRTDVLLSAILGVSLGAQSGAGEAAVTRIGDSIRSDIASWRASPPA